MSDAECATEEPARNRAASTQWHDRTAVARWDDRTAFAQWDEGAKRELLDILSAEVWDIEEELARVKEARARLMTSLQGNVAHRTG